MRLCMYVQLGKLDGLFSYLSSRPPPLPPSHTLSSPLLSQDAAVASSPIFYLLRLLVRDLSTND
jgi:hypothetical protein